MEERLQKILSARGVASRRASEAYIKNGRVTVNGAVSSLGMSADPEKDIILIDGKPIPAKPEYIYIILNKPRGFVTTTSDEKGRKDVTLLVKDAGRRVYPIGRLDMNSEGLLLLTNDGEFANMVMHPSFDKEKVYIVTVKGDAESALPALVKPIEINGSMTRGAEVKIISADSGRAKLQFTISEGRNRQVRRLCESAGLEVLRLRRVRIGDVCLGSLPAGKWRQLTAEEIVSLKKSEK